MTRQRLRKVKTAVVKVGSNLLASLSGGLDTAFIFNLVGEIAALRQAGKKVVLVSSGAVAAGTAELGLRSRPTNLQEIQAAAAVGQGALIQVYRDAFAYHRLKVGQVLLTRDVIESRPRFLHARNTLLTLLSHGVLPIVNENDTVAVEELKLKVGDNDALAVSVAQLTDADCLVILTDVPGLYDRPPADDGAMLISHVAAVTPAVKKMAGGSVSGVGSGGMASKLNAALAASISATPLVVADGRQPNILADIFAGKEVGTFFAPRKQRVTARRQWLAFSRQPTGVLVVDDGARQALVEGGKSLLPIGVREVRGDFEEGETVSIVDLRGIEIGRGLVNFNAEEMRSIAGRNSVESRETLGYDAAEEAIHRDNLVIISAEGDTT